MLQSYIKSEYSHSEDVDSRQKKKFFGLLCTQPGRVRIHAHALPTGLGSASPAPPQRQVQLAGSCQSPAPSFSTVRCGKRQIGRVQATVWLSGP